MIILENEKSFINNKIQKKHLFKNKKKFLPKKILVMGLPGSGKTRLSKELKK